jgi:two-component system phosphate regulon sensor histidine kinase PhoR
VASQRRRTNVDELRRENDELRRALEAFDAERQSHEQRVRERAAEVDRAHLDTDRERRRLRRLLERLNEGVITVDRELRIESANAVARQMLGVRQLASGNPLPDVWDDLSLREYAASLIEDSREPPEERLHREGDHTYSVRGVPAGDLETAILILADVSVRERRERAEREFVTNAAHELRTPLASIISSIEVLQAGAKDVPEERDRFLGHIQRETDRLARFSRALLVLARVQTGQERPRPQLVRLCTLLEQVAESLPLVPSVEVQVECTPELVVLADPDLVEQIVLNLGSNAARYTQRGTIVLAAREEGESAVIEVRDSGSGVPPAVRERVFDRFFRGERDRAGFGLGLAIAAEAARALGGEVELDSERTGTTVRVTLPYSGVVEREVTPHP